LIPKINEHFGQSFYSEKFYHHSGFKRNFFQSTINEQEPRRGTWNSKKFFPKDASASRGLADSWELFFQGYGSSGSGNQCWRRHFNIVHHLRELGSLGLEHVAQGTEAQQEHGKLSSGKFKILGFCNIVWK